MNEIVQELITTAKKNKRYYWSKLYTNAFQIHSDSREKERFIINASVLLSMEEARDVCTLFKCNKKEILEPLLILLTPYAPHISEELWHSIGNSNSILDATFPVVDESYLVENTYAYPVAINGKTRTELTFPLDIESALLQEEVLQNEIVSKWMEGQTIKKFIYVKGKMINVVI